MSQNPLATRLKNAGISTETYKAYCGWGIGSSPFSTDGDSWLQNTLIALSQVGNSLTIYSFSCSSLKLV